MRRIDCVYLKRSFDNRLRTQNETSYYRWELAYGNLTMIGTTVGYGVHFYLMARDKRTGERLATEQMFIDEYVLDEEGYDWYAQVDRWVCETIASSDKAADTALRMMEAEHV